MRKTPRNGRTPREDSDRVREILCREFTAFFTGMRTAEPGWPTIGPTAFVNALADSLLESGRQERLGVAMLQTLIYELQERVDAELHGV